MRTLTYSVTTEAVCLSAGYPAQLPADLLTREPIAQDVAIASILTDSKGRRRVQVTWRHDRWCVCFFGMRRVSRDAPKFPSNPTDIKDADCVTRQEAIDMAASILAAHDAAHSL